MTGKDNIAEEMTSMLNCGTVKMENGAPSHNSIKSIIHREVTIFQMNQRENVTYIEVIFNLQIVWMPRSVY